MTAILTGSELDPSIVSIVMDEEALKAPAAIKCGCLWAFEPRLRSVLMQVVAMRPDDFRLAINDIYSQVVSRISWFKPFTDQQAVMAILSDAGVACPCDQKPRRACAVVDQGVIDAINTVSQMAATVAHPPLSPATVMAIRQAILSGDMDTVRRLVRAVPAPTPPAPAQSTGAPACIWSSPTPES